MRIVSIVGVALLLSAPGTAAKEFVNLDFDEGDIPSPPSVDFFEPADLVLPGWIARMGNHVQSEILWNNALSSNGYVGVTSPIRDAYLTQGRYGVRLQAGSERPSAGPVVPASISQVGTIPQNARSLIFRSNLGYAAPTEIRLGDQVLTPFLLGDPQHQPIWGGEWAVDVSKFAGHEGLLSFTTFPYPNQDFGGMDIDSLRFSSTVTVPEPSAYAFGGIGLALLTWFQIKRRSPR